MILCYKQRQRYFLYIKVEPGKGTYMNELCHNLISNAYELPLNIKLLVSAIHIVSLIIRIMFIVHYNFVNNCFNYYSV